MARTFKSFIARTPGAPGTGKPGGGSPASVISTQEIPNGQSVAPSGPTTERLLGENARGGHVAAGSPDKPKEIGGPEGPEPTRYGDWERKGICTDF